MSEYYAKLSVLQCTMNVSSNIIVIIFSKLIVREHVCKKKFHKHDVCTREWWENTNMGCSCKILKLLSLVCKKWRYILQKNTIRLYVQNIMKYKLSFRYTFKCHQPGLCEQLLFMFMREVKRGSCKIPISGNTVFIGHINIAFKDWCKRHGHNLKISASNFTITKIRILTEKYIKHLSLDFRIIDV